MKIKKLNVGIDEIDQIFHISDIHIRNNSRHSEYRKVFKQFYADVKKNKTDNSIIFIGGDIAHAKLEMSPELVGEMDYFFTNCAKLCPTIIILGNHDCSENNKERLDVLSPVIKALNNRNLFYLKKSGLYRIGDCIFNVMCFLDKHENFICGKDIKEKGKKIALFHGPIDNSKTHVGYTISNRDFPAEIFDGHDMALCGDIHKQQTVQERGFDRKNIPLEDLDEYIEKGYVELVRKNDRVIVEMKDSNKPIIAYSSSAICQNYGETTKGHGYLIWDVKNESYEFVELKNDYAHYTMIVDDGMFDPYDDMPLKAKLRIKVSATDGTTLKRIITDIRKTHKLSEVNIIRTDTLAQVKGNAKGGVLNFGNIEDINIQNNFISDYLNRKFVVDKKTKKLVLEINKELNENITKDNIIRNVRWSPKIFKFGNMFSYGPDNKIDFTEMRDVIGIFAKNASGKSSIWSALSFCLFDKCDRAYKASHIMNTSKKTFKCEFSFELGGEVYHIERVGIKNKKGIAKVNVEFWKEGPEYSETDGEPVLNDDGEIIGRICLNGDHRRSTNDVIRKYLGGYDDFVITTLSLQNNNAIFIDKPQTERKELLGQFIGTNVFDRLYNIGLEDIKEITAVVKNFNRDDYTQSLADIEKSLDSDKKSYKDVAKILDGLQSERRSLNEIIDDKTRQIINVDAPSNLNKLNDTKERLTKERTGLKDEMHQKKFMIDTSIRELKRLEVEIKQIKESGVKDNHEKYISLEKELTAIESQMAQIKVLVQQKIGKIKKLEDHKYDPNCEHCVNNVFVQDAMKCKKTIIEDKDKALKMINMRKHLTLDLETLSGAAEKYQEYLDNQTKFSNRKHKVALEMSAIESKKSKIETLNNDLKYNREGIELYHKSKDTIEKNKLIESEIKELQDDKREVQQRVDIRDSEKLELHGRIEISKSKIDDIELRIDEAKEYEDKLEAYEYYLEAVGRNGVPYELIEKSIPTIQAEVNAILEQIVEFGIQFELDGKNIQANIVYEERSWPLELSSGAERFISGLAIRMALINISSLPRPNFMVIDEGWSTLDADNIVATSNLMQYLKNQFDFSIIISHDEKMRDMVDSSITIIKKDGFSSINY